MAIFSNLTKITSTGDGNSISATIIDAGETIEFSIGSFTVERSINDTYIGTSSSSSGTYYTTFIQPSPYAASSDASSEFSDGSSTILFEVIDETSTSTGSISWTVDVSQGDTSTVVDDSSPSYTSPDINITFYSGTGDGTDRIKIDGFDPTLVDSVLFEYTLSGGTSASGTFDTLTSSPFCATLLNDAVQSISTMDLVRVSFSDGTTEDVIVGLDYANDVSIQSNVWPNECVEGNGSSTGGDTEVCATVEDSLCSIASSLSSIASSLASIADPSSKQNAFNRAATINALRESQQLENVFDELQNPTKVPDVGYGSEEELSGKPDDFFRPESESFDPSYEDQSCPFDPIPPEELRQAEEEQNGGDGGTENPEDDISLCHPDY